MQILNEYFKTRSEIEVAYIFGSMSQNKDNVLSDIDIAVMLNKECIDNKLYPYGYKAHLLSALMKLLKTDKVDLVILNEAPILLKHRVLYFGKVVCTNNDKKRIQFQVETINKYSDFKYLCKTHSEKLIAK